jgi:hypothetical protein
MTKTKDLECVGGRCIWTDIGRVIVISNHLQCRKMRADEGPCIHGVGDEYYATGQPLSTVSLFVQMAFATIAW